MVRGAERMYICVCAHVYMFVCRIHAIVGMNAVQYLRLPNDVMDSDDVGPEW